MADSGTAEACRTWRREAQEVGEAGSGWATRFRLDPPFKILGGKNDAIRTNKMEQIIL